MMDLEGASRILVDIFDTPDAERPYADLARKYKDSGRDSDAEALLFLIEKRFGGQIAHSTDSGAGRHQVDSEDP